MRDTAPVSTTIRCDGCGREVSTEHIRQRITRLEWASRFRPIHITTLFLAPAPSAALADAFYSPEELPGNVSSHTLFGDLLEASGGNGNAESRQAALGRFQHGGFYFAEAVECPVAPEEGFPEILSRLTPTVIRRIRHSYRPQSVILLSDELAPLAAALAGAGLDARLLLLDAKPVPLPGADGESRSRFRNRVQDLLKLTIV
jgi:hypothetical protein